MRGIAILAAALFAGAGGSHAASFDCAKARKPAEKEVCAKPQLSRLDEELAAAFRSAMAVTHRPAKLASDQRWWLRERDQGHGLESSHDPLTGEGLVEHYRERLAILKREIARGDAARRPFTRAELHQRCSPMGRVVQSGECGPTGAGRLPGDTGAPVLIFQTEAGGTDEGVFGGLAVFEAAEGDALRPVLWAYDYGVWGMLQLFRSPAGWLMVVDVEAEGEEGDPYVEQVIFRQKDGRWRDVDTEGFWRAVRERTPKDRWADDGASRMDFNAMTGRTPVRWNDGRPGDAGSARYTFALEGDALVLKTFAVDPPR